MRRWSGRHSATARRSVVAGKRRHGIKPARASFAIRVDTTAICIPEWALMRREESLSVSEHHVWFRGRSNGRAQILARQDREAGGSPELTTTEFRICPVCKRVMLGYEAEARRLLDEGEKDGRQRPCGPECK